MKHFTAYVKKSHPILMVFEFPPISDSVDAAFITTCKLYLEMMHFVTCSTLKLSSKALNVHQCVPMNYVGGRRTSSLQVIGEGENDGDFIHDSQEMLDEWIRMVTKASKDLPIMTVKPEEFDLEAVTTAATFMTFAAFLFSLPGRHV